MDPNKLHLHTGNPNQHPIPANTYNTVLVSPPQQQTMVYPTATLVTQAAQPVYSVQQERANAQVYYPPGHGLGGKHIVHATNHPMLATQYVQPAPQQGYHQPVFAVGAGPAMVAPAAPNYGNDYDWMPDLGAMLWGQLVMVIMIVCIVILFLF